MTSYMLYINLVVKVQSDEALKSNTSVDIQIFHKPFGSWLHPDRSTEWSYACLLARSTHDIEYTRRNTENRKAIGFMGIP